MRYPYLFLLSLLLCQSAWAWASVSGECNSYEECIHMSVSCTDSGLIKGCDEITQQMYQTFYQKAIAYKLDEISHKLDKQDAYLPMGPMLLKKDKIK